MMSDLLVVCWTAVLSRLGLISSTFALYQILELELFEYFKSTRTLVNPSQVYMFRRTVFNNQKFENFQSKACNYVQVLCCAAKRREALQNTLLVNKTRRSNDVRPIGGVLNSCFVQIRTHQQHFCPLPDFRAGALRVLQKYPHAS